MLNLHRVLLCTGIDIDDIMQLTVWLIVFCFLSLFIGWLHHLVLCINILFAKCKGGNFNIISGRGFAISSAMEGKSGPIYNLVKS